MPKRFSRNPRAECVYLAGTMTGWRSTLLIDYHRHHCRCFDYQYHHFHQILVSTFNLFICSDVRWWANLPGRVTGCASWRWSSSSSWFCWSIYIVIPQFLYFIHLGTCKKGDNLITNITEWEKSLSGSEWVSENSASQEVNDDSHEPDLAS